MPLIRILLACALGIHVPGSAAAPASLNVAVASNLSHALTEIAAAFEEETGIRPRLTFGSSGNFTRQIIQGAPFKIFISADSKYVRILRDRNIALLADVEYARGRIGIFLPARSPLAGSGALDEVIKNMFHGKYSRLVIANPEHAPFGVAAKQALQNAGLWVIERERLLLAENAVQATQIAISGDVDLGIIPASHALIPAVSDRGKFLPIPESWHAPLRQHLLLLQGAGSTDQQFFDYLQRDGARQVLINHGYSVARGGGRIPADGLAGP